MMKRFLTFLTLLLAMTAAAEQGSWKAGSDGLPVYDFNAPLPVEATDDMGGDASLPEDPYFLLGNYRMGLFTHVSGIWQFMTAQRAWARVNASGTQPNYGENDAYVMIGTGGNARKIDLVGLESVSSDPDVTERHFGIGFARYSYDLPSDVKCERVVSVRPSDRINEGVPAFLVTVTLRNEGSRTRKISYVESMPVRYVTMQTQMMDPEDRPIGYPVVMKLSEDGKSVIADVSARRDAFIVMPETHQRFPYEIDPSDVFVYVHSTDDRVLSSSSFDGDVLRADFGVNLRPGESQTFHVVWGLVDDMKDHSAEEVYDVLLKDADLGECPEGAFMSLWKKAVPDFSSEDDEVVRRELYWNAHFVEASAKYSEYFDETFIPQGTVYSYHYGDNIANRDHLQAMLPACYTNPALAKSALRYVMKHTDADGEIKRGNLGYGYTPPIIYKESDQQIYMLNSVAEYLRVTGDYAFLDEEVEQYPAESGVRTKVLTVLQKHFIHLRDEIGLGPDGLIKLHNSDWSDSFLHAYSPNKYSWSAESHLNTVMALAVLPEFIFQMEKSGREDGVEFVASMKVYSAQIEKAYMEDLGDRLYSPRAYLDKTHRFGLDVVCIEPQGYLLQLKTIEPERKREMYEYMKARISDIEPIGVRTRENPLWDGLPQGEDGGIWFSLEYPFLLGVSTFDKEEAWKLFRKFSFDNFARNYPDYWVGQWTAADEVNSTLYRPGLYAFWIPIDNYRHGLQGYCSHPHTWPLYCYFKLKE